MKIKNFNKGIISSSLGSFWWGVFGTYYFQYITFIGTFEVVFHRSIWTCVILLFTTTFFKKWNLFKKILLNKKNFFVLILTSILIFGNWTVWIYAVSTNRIIDASFGYFIFPIISVFFGYIFLKEKLNKKRIISISLVIIATIYLLFDFSSLPWVGFTLAFLWSIYNLLRKKISVETDIGLLIESLFILPLAILFFYFMIEVLIVGVILIFFAGWVIATILDAKREKEEIDKINAQRPEEIKKQNENVRSGKRYRLFL